MLKKKRASPPGPSFKFIRGAMQEVGRAIRHLEVGDAHLDPLMVEKMNLLRGRAPPVWLRLCYHLPVYIRDIDLERETMDVCNPSRLSIPMGGCYIKDQDGRHTFEFPDDFKLKPWSMVTIFTCAGQLSHDEREEAESFGERSRPLAQDGLARDEQQHHVKH